MHAPLHRRSRRVAAPLIALVAACAVGASDSAAAQAWLPDRVRTEGEGFRTDSAEIHTNLATDVGIDNNVYLEDTDPDLAAVLRITGGLYIRPRRRQGDGGSADAVETPENRRVDFRFGLNASYYHYFSNSVRDNVSGGLDASVHVRPDAKVSFELGESLVRTIRPFTDATTSGSGNISYGMNRSNTSATLHFRSESGVLRGAIGFGGDFTFFDSTLFNANNNFESRITTRLNWAFFPRTSLFYEGGASFLRYGVASSGDTYSRVVGSRRLTGIVGVNGILTPKIAVTLAAGYAAGFFAVGSEYDGYVARAELRYRPRPGITLTAGFGHDFQPSYIGNFNDVTSGYLNSEMAFANRFLLGTQLNVGFGESGQARRADGSFLGNFTTRVDTRLLARLYGEYRPTSWLALTVSLEYLGDFTDFAFVTPPGAVGIIPDPTARYQRVDLWLGARVYH